MLFTHEQPRTFWARPWARWRLNSVETQGRPSVRVRMVARLIPTKTRGQDDACCQLCGVSTCSEALLPTLHSPHPRPMGGMSSF
jgi:hypothetical protein